jgi:beta-galactosidase
MLGVCYYPEHWAEESWADDARRMREMGVRFVRIGEFAWSRIEPEPGRFEFGWLRRAMDVLSGADLKIVLGTPTATPPKWLMDRHPEIAPVDRESRPRGFGSRRHYSFSSLEWLAQTRRIVERIAQELGAHPGLVGWQTDNEYGCHDTILSWGAHDLAAFRDWLQQRYQSPQRLNEAWGNVFWSMEVNSFDEVSLPMLTVTEANPAARLDFWRFSSEQVAAYDRMQSEIIRRHSPGRFVTHNFMGLFHDFDHFACAAHLDFASWDSYPLGLVERFPFSPEEKLRWAETSHPDMASFHHDLYRGVGRGRWWVMEQQPGPVNWAAWNPIPRKGQIRLFTWEALAHGAEVVSYFRWRQAPYAQEQMHAGLNLPDNSGLSQGGVEASEVGRELARIGALPESRRAPVALVFDYEASWILRIQPQGADFDYTALTFRWYEAVRRLGLDVDFVEPGSDVKAYQIVLVPSLPYVSNVALAAIGDTEAQVLFGPRSGSKTRHFSIPANLPPGPLAALLPIRIREVASLRPGLEKPVNGSLSGKVSRWREFVELTGEAEAVATFADGSPAFVQAGHHHYLAGWPDGALLAQILKRLAWRAGVTTQDLPDHIRIRRRGSLSFAFNYGDEGYELSGVSNIVLGASTLAPGEVTIWRDGADANERPPIAN